MNSNTIFALSSFQCCLIYLSAKQTWRSKCYLLVSLSVSRNVENKEMMTLCDMMTWWPKWPEWPEWPKWQEASQTIDRMVYLILYLCFQSACNCSCWFYFQFECSIQIILNSTNSQCPVATAINHPASSNQLCS